MRCPRLKDLPDAPIGKQGWPWTEESDVLPRSSASETEWPRITLITPSLNQASFLEETLRSVLLQGYPNLEYFVLDGGSTDGSIEIIKRYSPWIDYWTSGPDGGQSAAINRGFHMGSGSLATWLNSDDLLCRNALVKQLSARELSQSLPAAHPIYVGTCLYVNVEGDVLSSHRGRIHSLDDLFRIRTVWRSGGHIVQPEVLFPRELALEVGGLDEDNHYTMDYELWGKLLLAGAKFQYSDVEFAMFRIHSNQKTTDMLRITDSLVDTASKLVSQSHTYTDETRDAVLADLEAYRRDYENMCWKASGRLSRLGLPRSVVTRLRGLRSFLPRKAI